MRRGVSFVAFLYKNLACLMSLGLIMFCVEMHSLGDNVRRGGLMMNCSWGGLRLAHTQHHQTLSTERPAVMSSSVSLISRDAVLRGRRPRAVPFGGRGAGSGNCRN